jgi:hypothetical protein
VYSSYIYCRLLNIDSNLPFLKVDSNKKRGVRKKTGIQLLYGIVAIEGYLQFKRVVSLYILNRQGGSNLQDNYSNIGGLHGIAYLKSQLDAPILLAQLYFDFALPIHPDIAY